jgi:hypothetical protein
VNPTPGDSRSWILTPRMAGALLCARFDTKERSIVAALVAADHPLPERGVLVRAKRLGGTVPEKPYQRAIWRLLEDGVVRQIADRLLVLADPERWNGRIPLGTLAAIDALVNPATAPAVRKETATSGEPCQVRQVDQERDEPSSTTAATRWWRGRTRPKQRPRRGVGRKRSQVNRVKPVQMASFQVDPMPPVKQVARPIEAADVIARARAFFGDDSADQLRRQLPTILGWAHNRIDCLMAAVVHCEILGLTHHGSTGYLSALADKYRTNGIPDGIRAKMEITATTTDLGPQPSEATTLRGSSLSRSGFDRC